MLLLKILLAFNLLMMICSLYTEEIKSFYYFFIHQLCIICGLLIGPPAFAAISLLYFKEFRPYWIAMLCGLYVGVAFFGKAGL